ncbi:MAG: XisH family protein [Candidatus Tectomicrobia bacterium]|uniref:XisH family protein n=1 Tax=Tectimicrobiota bacterium TaxID=2528274 RepID=A0A932CN34_UNCTE|nr:XisH family protein [Candidatus Tectomicrobia bacterium]
MPQHDLYHNTVKQALIKDSWIITDDPFIIEFKGLRLYADLGAERTFAAEKYGHRIVVEIKVFSSASLITELEKAVGQYSIYRTFLKLVNPDRELYLAIAQDVYQDFFRRPAIEEIILDQQIHLLIFDPNTEEVVQWIK